MFPNPQDTLPLPQHPDIEQYRKLAKELVEACRRGSNDAAIKQWATAWVQRVVKLAGIDFTPDQPVDVDRWTEQVSDFACHKLASAHGGKCSLAQAQFVIARAHGFESWPKFIRELEELAHDKSAASAFDQAADAIVRGDAARLRDLLRDNPELVRERSRREHRATLLHYTSANGIEGYRQKTPANIVEIARILLDAGAEVDAVADVYGGGSTTLGLAATSVHPERAGVQEELMQLLLDRGATIEQVNIAGNNQSIVNACLANGRAAAAEFLAEKGAPLDLEGACGLGRLDLVQKLVESTSGLDQEQLTRGFRWACGYRRNEVVDFLLARDPELGTRPGASGETGLHRAGHEGHAEIVAAILQANRTGDVNIRDKQFHGTPLDWALHGWSENPKRGDYYAVLRALIKAGARFHASEHRAELLARLRGDERMRELLGM
jgi:ankyrin repeat protein